jgi:hypothetical protein
MIREAMLLAQHPDVCSYVALFFQSRRQAFHCWQHLLDRSGWANEVPRIDINLPEVAEALAQDTALPNETEVVRTPRGGMHIAVISTHPA